MSAKEKKLREITCYPKFAEKTLQRSKTTKNIETKDNKLNTNDNKKKYFKKTENLYSERSEKKVNTINPLDKKIDSLRSNIFNEDKKESEYKNIIKKPKIVHTETKEESLKKKAKRYNTTDICANGDWKYCNTEVFFHDNKNKEKIDIPKLKTHNLIKSEITSNKPIKSKIINSKNKINFTNTSSVEYNVLTARNINRKNLENNCINRKNENATTEYYEILVNKEFDSVKIDKIEKIFTDKKIHIYNVTSHPDIIANNKGKISIRIRKFVNDKDFDKNIKTVEQEIKNQQMTLNKLTYSDAYNCYGPKIRKSTPTMKKSITSTDFTGKKFFIKKRNVLPIDYSYKNHTKHVKS